MYVFRAIVPLEFYPDMHSTIRGLFLGPLTSGILILVQALLILMVSLQLVILLFHIMTMFPSSPCPVVPKLWSLLTAICLYILTL